MSNSKQATGLLWYDVPDLAESETVDTCVERAVRAYMRKWRRRPEYVLVHPGTLDGYKSGNGFVKADLLVLPGHYLVGPAPAREE